MTETLLLTRRDVAELLPMSDCIDAVAEAFRAQASGRTLPSGVLGLHAPAGGLHVKAAGFWRDRLYLAAKVNSNFPGNPESRGLPTIQGLLTLFDGEDGRPLAIIDSTEITALRTGAATAIAARYMARTNAGVLAVFGCGRQAGFQVRALAVVRRIRQVLACDRDPERALQFAATLSEQGIPTTVEGAGSALRKAEIIVTCTPSKRAIVGPADVSPGTFVAAVGADDPGKQELDPLLLARSRVVVDSLEQAANSGDLHHALMAGVLQREDVHGELWELVAGTKRGRASDDEITVFDSTGVASEDVAAAALVYERATAAGRGTSLRIGD